VLAKIKLGRLGQLDEVTGAIVFLASDAIATSEATKKSRTCSGGVANFRTRSQEADLARPGEAE
jgi:hypothetical protein